MFVESSIKANALGATMTKRVKRIGCSSIKDLIEQGKLKINDANTIDPSDLFEENIDGLISDSNFENSNMRVFIILSSGCHLRQVRSEMCCPGSAPD